jgi:hypothetical protein
VRRLLRGWRILTADTRVVPLAAGLATTTALVAFVVQHPTAAVWAVVVALVLALAAMVALVKEANDWRAEYDAAHAANELLCEELACSDQIIHALQNDRLAADLAAYDAAVTEPVPFVPADGPHLRVVRDDLAALDAEATAYTWPSIARDAFPVREWGEEAEQ